MHTLEETVHVVDDSDATQAKAAMMRTAEWLYALAKANRVHQLAVVINVEPPPEAGADHATDPVLDPTRSPDLLAIERGSAWRTALHICHGKHGLQLSRYTRELASDIAKANLPPRVAQLFNDIVHDALQAAESDSPDSPGGSKCNA